MTSPGPRPKKSGFLANIQAAMAPPIPADDGQPLRRPPSVTVASVLVMVAAVMFMLIGVLSVSSTGSQANSYRTFYSSAVKQCTDVVGGIGTAVPTTVATPTAGVTTPLALTALPNSCRQITAATLSAGALSSYKTTLVVFSVLLGGIGLVTRACGWFIRAGGAGATRGAVRGLPL